MRIRFFTIFIAYIIHSLFSNVNSIYFDVRRNYETCIFNEFFTNTILIINYDTLIDDPESIKAEDKGLYQIQIKNNEKDKVFDKQIMKKLSDKVIFVVPESNVYNVCISAISKQKALYDDHNFVKVSLALSSSDVTPNLPHEKYPDNESLRLLDEIIKTLHQSTDNIIKNNDFMMQNEEAFSHFQEENGRLLIMISLLQLLLVMAIVVYSLCSLKSQLNKILN